MLLGGIGSVLVDTGRLGLCVPSVDPLDIQFLKERQPDGGHKANCCLENSLVGSGGGTGNFHEVWQFC